MTTTEHPIPEMPADFEPRRSEAHRLEHPVLSEADRRIYWLHEQGYTGPIDPDGYVIPVEQQRREQAHADVLYMVRTYETVTPEMAFQAVVGSAVARTYLSDAEFRATVEGAHCALKDAERERS